MYRRTSILTRDSAFNRSLFAPIFLGLFLLFGSTLLAEKESINNNCTFSGVGKAYDVTSTTALLYFWQFPSQPAIAQFQIEYGEAGFTQGTGIFLGVPANDTIQINGLQPDKEYKVIWSGFCQGGIQSGTTVSMSFRTSCSGIAPLPIAETFNAIAPNEGGVISNCWHLKVEDGPGFMTAHEPFWETEIGINNMLTGPSTAQGGQGSFIYLNTTQGAVGEEAHVLSEVYDFTNQFEVDLTFYYHMFGVDMGDLHIDVNDGAGWINGIWSKSGSKQTSAAEPWIADTVSLSPFAGSPNVQLRFRGVKGGPASFMALDDIAMESTGDGLADFDPLEIDYHYPGHAIINARIIDDGRSTILERGVVYALHPNPTIADDSVTSGLNTGSFEVILDNLQSETTYFIRPFARNGNGVSYGPEKEIFIYPFALVDTTSFNWVVNESHGIGYVVENSSGALFVSGENLTLPNGVQQPHGGLFKVNSDGSINQFWMPQLDGGKGIIGEAPSIISKMQIHQGGHLYFSGNIDSVDNQPRHGLARYDLTTGALDPWAPVLNFPSFVRNFVIHQNSLFAIVLDSVSDYHVDSRLVQIDLTTGSISPWTPNFSGNSNKISPYALAIFDDHLIVGGYFQTVDGISAPYLVAFDLNNNLQQSNWNSNVNGIVEDLLVVDDKLLASGNFNQVNGQAVSGLMVFDNLTSAPSQINQSFDFSHGQSAVYGLSAHGRTIFSSTYLNGESKVYRFPISNINKVEEVPEVQQVLSHGGYDQLLSRGDELLVIDRGSRVLPNIHGGVISVIRPSTIFIDTEPIAKPRPDIVILGGEVLNEGGLGVSESGFVWDTIPQPDFNDHFKIVSSGLGVFDLQLVAEEDSLEFGATYYVRSFAISASDTVFGSEESFALSQDPCKLAVEIPHLQPFSSWGLCWSPNADTSISDANLSSNIQVSIEDNDHFRYRNTNAASPSQLPELITPIFDITEEAQLQFRWSHAIPNPNASSNLLVSYQINGSAIWDTLAYYTQMHNADGLQYLPPQNEGFIITEIPLDNSLIGEKVLFKFSFDFTESDFYLDAFGILPSNRNCNFNEPSPPYTFDFNNLMSGQSDTLSNCVQLTGGFITKDGNNGLESLQTAVTLTPAMGIQESSIILPSLVFISTENMGRGYLEFDFHASGQDFVNLEVESYNRLGVTSIWSFSGQGANIALDSTIHVHINLRPYLTRPFTTSNMNNNYLQIRLVAHTNGNDSKVIIDNINLDDSSRYEPFFYNTYVSGVSSNEALIEYSIGGLDYLYRSQSGICYGTSPNVDTASNVIAPFDGRNSNYWAHPHTGVRNVRIKNLMTGQLYYARPFILTDDGVIYGHEFSFQTNYSESLSKSHSIPTDFFYDDLTIIRKDGSEGWYYVENGQGWSRVLHIDPNGHKSIIFTAPEQGGISTFIQDIKLDQNKLYIAGKFNLVNNQAINNLARVDIATGQLDSWFPDLQNDTSIKHLVIDSGRLFAHYYDNNYDDYIAEVDIATAQVQGSTISVLHHRYSDRIKGMLLFQNHLIVYGDLKAPGTYGPRSGLIAYDIGNNMQPTPWAINSSNNWITTSYIWDAEVSGDSVLVIGGLVSDNVSSYNLAVFDSVGAAPISERSTSNLHPEYIAALELMGDDIIIGHTSQVNGDLISYWQYSFEKSRLTDLFSSTPLPELNTTLSFGAGFYSEVQDHIEVQGCHIALKSVVLPPAHDNSVRNYTIDIFSPGEPVFDPIWEWSQPTDSSIHPSSALVHDGAIGLQEFGFCISTQPNPEISDTIGETPDPLMMEHEFIGLESNTSYYVRAYVINCDTVYYSQQTQFTTEPDCSPVSLPYSSDFEQDDDLLCWKLSDQVAIERKINCPAPGNAAMNLWGQSFTYLESPFMDIDGLTGIRVSFDFWDAIGQCGDDAEAGDKLVFGWVDTNSTFNILATYEGDVAPNAPSTVSFDIPITYNGEFFFRFEIFGGDGMMTDNWMVDNFLVEKIDICHLVGLPGVAGHIGNTAMVYFDPLVTQNDYVLEYGQQGFVPGTGVIIGSTKDTVQIPNLAGGVTMDVYWSAICPNGDTTNSVLQTFTTPCDVLSIPYAESFDNIPANCWILDEGDEVVPQADNDYLYGFFWNWAQGQKGIARSPRLNVSGSASLSFKWAHKHMPAWPDDSLILEARVEGDANWTALTILEGVNFDSPNANNSMAPNDTDFVQETLELPASLENEIVEFRFVFISGYGPNVYVDDFSVNLDPVCSLSIDSITELNVNNGIYRAHFDTISGDVLRLQFKGVNEANWRSRPIWRGDIGSQRFNLTPSFGTDVAVRIAIQIGGIWEYGCPDTISVPCRNQILNIAVEEEAFCAEDSVLLRAGYAGGQGAPTFTWNNGSNAKRIFAQQGETVFVTVTDLAGCSVTDTIIAPELDAIGAPANFSLTKLNSTTYRGIWNAPVLDPGMNLIAYRMAYRLRGTTVWTITPFINDTFNVIDFSGSALPAGNYEFTVFSRFNNGVRNTSSEFACLVVKGYNGSGNKRITDSDSNNNLSQEVNVYPNPTNGILHINGPDGAEVQLLDMKGSLVRNAAIDHAEISLDLTDLAQGVYTLKVLYENATFNERIMKR